MDFIRKYDIELEKEYYYAGEVVRGCVALENLETLRVNGMQSALAWPGSRIGKTPHNFRRETDQTRLRDLGTGEASSCSPTGCLERNPLRIKLG